MELKETFLFHQIHPAKLATDIMAAVVSLYFFWQHDLVAGLLTHFLPPPVGSAFVIAFADLEPYKNSRLGAYLARYMMPAAHAARLIGDIIMIVAAWFHSPVAIGGGLIIILAAWSCGLLGLYRS